MVDAACDVVAEKDLDLFTDVVDAAKSIRQATMQVSVYSLHAAFHEHK